MNEAMGSCSPGFPKAGISESEGHRGLELVLNTKTQVSESTPSLVVDNEGHILAQTFLRPSNESENVRTAEMWHRARMIASFDAFYDACLHAAKSCHHPACKCHGEYAANPERYCPCHVYKAQAALETLKCVPNH